MNMEQTKVKTLSEKVRSLPQTPGVYIMKDQYGNIIYIGKAIKLKNRVSSYFVKTKKPLKISQMVSKIADFDYILTHLEIDTLNLESNLIKKHKPYYNTKLKDGKPHAFFKINLKAEFPKLEITRQIKQNGAKYFGPYFSGVTVGDLKTIISTAFDFNDCLKEGRNDKPYDQECLNYFLGNKKKINFKQYSSQNYLKEVKKVIDFLNGDLTIAKEKLIQKMHKNAEVENFEKAIELRNSLGIIAKLSQKVVTELPKNINLDIFGYATNGYYSVVSVLVVRAGKMVGASNYFVLDSNESESEILNNFIMQYYPQESTIPKEIVSEFSINENVLKLISEQENFTTVNTIPTRGTKLKLLQMANQNASEHLVKNLAKTEQNWLKTHGAMEILQKDLNLSKLPARIECYDISNLQGTNIVASMVVFINGEPAKNHYRKFSIKSVSGHNDDFQSMHEVLTRRIAHMLDPNETDESFKYVPDLIVIDGGKGQLSSAYSVLVENNLKIDMISLAKKQEEIFVPYMDRSIYLSRDNVGLKMLQNLRDEAHRFAITFHRQKRTKSSIETQLEKIKGIGKTTAINLYKHFKTLQAIKTATPNDLLKVKGVTKSQAASIYNYFRQDSEE